MKLPNFGIFKVITSGEKLRRVSTTPLYSNAFYLMLSAVVMSLLGLNSSLTRFLPHTKKPQELINSCLTLGGLISLVLAGIFIAGLELWSPAMPSLGRTPFFAQPLSSSPFYGRYPP